LDIRPSVGGLLKAILTVMAALAAPDGPRTAAHLDLIECQQAAGGLEVARIR
jgi:hypothetical protein